MADKFAGGVLAGSVDVSIPIILRVKSDGAELTGKVATAVVVYYHRQSAVSVVEVTAATLGSMGAVHSNGGWFEYDSTRMPGLYRLDLPDTAFSTGAEWVVVGVKDTANSGFLFYERFALETVHNNLLNTYISGAAISVAAGQLTAAVFGNDFITSAKVAAGALTYDDQITTFKSELSGMAINIPNDHITSAKIAAGALVYDDQIVTFKSELSGLVITIPNDHITSAKVAAGALSYDDQIVTFKSELSGMAVSIPDGHITSAKIGADAIGSDKVAGGAFVYGDQITVFDASIKSAASAAWADANTTNRVTPADGSITAAVLGADCITSAKVAAGAFTYDDQITTFKSELSGLVPVLTGYRLSTQGVRDITQYTSAMGGVPGSSPALIDAVYWGVRQNAYQRIQTPTTYIVHDAAGNAVATAPISGTSTQVTIGIFSNV